MPFYSGECGIILTVFAKNRGMNAIHVIPELPILRFTSLAVELLFSYCSTDFSLPLVSLYFYLCGRQGDIFTKYFGLHQLSLCVF